LGTGVALEREYGKVNPERLWLDRALWGVIGWVVVVALSAFITGLTTGVTMLGSALALPGNVLGSMAALVRLAALIGVALGLWRVCRSRGDHLERMAFWLRQHPIWAAILAGLILMGSSVFSGGMGFLVHRTVPIQTLSMLALWSTLTAGLTPVILWPMLLVWLLRRNTPKEATAQ
jgi:hypothetical protein